MSVLLQRLFRPTFQRYQDIVTINEGIQHALLPLANNPYAFSRIAQTYFATSLAQHYLKELQTPRIVEFVEQMHYEWAERGFQMWYDYGKNRMILQWNGNYQMGPASNQKMLPNSKAKSIQRFNEYPSSLSYGRIEIAGCPIQKMDHPAIRKSLYLHELKDMDKYITFNYPRSIPQFMKQENRKRTEMKILDQKNPLGVPIKAPPLKLFVDFDHKYSLKLRSLLGQVNIIRMKRIKSWKQVNMYQKSNPINLQQDDSERKSIVSEFGYQMSGLRIPRTIQELNHSLLSHYFHLNHQNLLTLHQLAFIVGRITALQRCFSYHSMVGPYEERQIAEDQQENEESDEETPNMKFEEEASKL